MIVLQIIASYLCIGVLTVVLSGVNPSPFGVGIILFWPLIWVFSIGYSCTHCLTEYKIKAAIDGLIEEIEDHIMNED